MARALVSPRPPGHRRRMRTAGTAALVRDHPWQRPSGRVRDHPWQRPSGRVPDQSLATTVGAGAGVSSGELGPVGGGALPTGFTTLPSPESVVAIFPGSPRRRRPDCRGLFSVRRTSGVVRVFLKGGGRLARNLIGHGPAAADLRVPDRAQDHERGARGQRMPWITPDDPTPNFPTARKAEATR